MAQKAPGKAPTGQVGKAHGTYHHWSPKHGDRYLAQFAGRHNVREADTIDQMTNLVASMVGRQLTYEDLTRGSVA